MSLEIGKQAEEKVAKFLIKDGYNILDKNFHSKFGEIDIVAKRGDVITFFEVKYSKDYDPIYRITPLKMKKIIKTIDYYFLAHNYDEEYQISAALVNEEGIEIIENIGF